MATQVQGNATSEKAEEKARAMSISTNDPEFNTPLIPASAATLIIHASTRVNAPASLVFRTLRNTETWRDWNNFVPRVTIRSQPREDVATDTEIEDLIRNTSYLVSIDSDLTEGGGPPAKNPAPPPPATSTDTSRRPSVASGKSGDTMSAAQRFQQTQAARKASTASGMSGKSGVSSAIAASSDATDPSPRPSSPAPAKLTETSSPATGGVLIHHGGTSTGTTGRKPAPATQTRRRSSLNAMYGEPSIRLKVNTAMTFHCRMELPAKPNSYKDVPLVVTEVSRPDDSDGWDEVHSGLARSKTHTLSRGGGYRIVWGTDHGAERTPRFMLTCQWVVEVRPVVAGDGREECEVRIWESLKGVRAGAVKKKYQAYLFEMFVGWVLGLRDHCEAMGGAVERRDFIKEYA